MASFLDYLSSKGLGNAGAPFGVQTPQEQAETPSALPDKLVSGMGNAAWQGFTAPGNAFNSTPANPVTTEQMIKPALNMAGMTMLGTPMSAPEGAMGIGPVIDMQGWAEARRMAQIRQNNIREAFANGGGIIHELPNHWKIGYLPHSSNDVSHILLSPQGGISLYGKSPTDLIKRGFYKEDAAPLLNYLGNK
jgi:hypothetical protein